MLMLEDRNLMGGGGERMKENTRTAEKAFEYKALEVRDEWAAHPSPRLRERLPDLNNVVLRVLGHLLHQGLEDGLDAIQRPSVVVARELAPGLTVQIDRERVVGLVSEEGTRTSHAAILAHSMGIPAVMGLSGALERIRPGTMIVLDGARGTVLLDPTPAEIAEADAERDRRQSLQTQLGKAVHEPAGARAQVPVALPGNVHVPQATAASPSKEAERVGLPRPEFLVTGHAQLPTENHPAAYFRKVGEAFKGHPVV